MPGIDFTHAPTWLQWVITAIAIAGGLATVFGLARMVWRINRGVMRAVELIDGLPARLTEQDGELARIRHEVLPNGGDSLADRSKRNEAAIIELLQGQEHIKRQVMAVKTTIARTDKKLQIHLTESAAVLERLEAGKLAQPKDTK